MTSHYYMAKQGRKRLQIHRNRGTFGEREIEERERKRERERERE